MSEKPPTDTASASKKRWMWRGIALAVAAIIVAVIVAVVVVVVRRQNQSQQGDGVRPTTGTGQDDNVSISKVGDLRALSKYANITLMATMQDDAFYGDKHKRLFVIGDIHGCIDEFTALIEKIQYNYEAGDRIILAGDLVVRGPDSVGVIRKAKEIKAMCVRGNHDDKVVRLMTYSKSNDSATIGKKGYIPEGPVYDPLEVDNYHMDIVRNMTELDYDYLSSCPMILAIPALDALFVHAGFNPDKPFDEQQPFAVMNVRTLDEDGKATKLKDGEEWSDIWNMQQEANNSTFPYHKVYYGHAAGQGLQLKNYTFGVDTGCVYGRNLTALEVKSGQLTQVPCQAYAE
ncbi:Metallo-dependent phosphatase-like protein [Fennellomyces sp. T-0311]|nr:Metallo-dependent phosphatase-like protein [Fennellomyces sp. T-0311]